MGFGKIGSGIMGSNFTETGEMNLIKQGEQINAVIAVCTINLFPAIIEAI